MNIAGFGRTLIRLSDISCDLELLAYLRRLFLSLQNDFLFEKPYIHEPARSPANGRPPVRVLTSDGIPQSQQSSAHLTFFL
jgi:hypothetical protein